LRQVVLKTAVHAERRIVDNGRVISPAGIAAGTDMSPHVVRRLPGREVAENTARRVGSPFERSDAMIRGIHHIQLTVPRGAEGEARRFYCGVLGLPEVQKPASLTGRGGLWLQVGDRQVHVGVEDGVNRHATKAHVAYEVCDLEEWKHKLAALGIAVIEGIPLPGHDRFEFRDPFGNRVEFIERL
jgi:catechol 2,3-dioxygenase-like lactoylglutathione lyase family enzyme